MYDCWSDYFILDAIRLLFSFIYVVNVRRVVSDASHYLWKSLGSFQGTLNQDRLIKWGNILTTNEKLFNINHHPLHGRLSFLLAFILFHFYGFLPFFTTEFIPTLFHEFTNSLNFTIVECWFVHFTYNFTFFHSLFLHPSRWNSFACDFIFLCKHFGGTSKYI